MKYRFIYLFSITFPFLLTAQDSEIILPDVTTYIPASVEQKIVVTAEDIAVAHYQSLSEVVERCGIQNLSYGPYGLESKPSIRGFTDETVRVVIDGICMNNAQYGTFDFSTVNLDAVEKIEVVRGGFTEGVEDEGAVGGVIYITMKKLEMKNSLSADVSAKTFFNYDTPLDSCFQKLSYTGRLGENTFLNTSGSLNYAQNHYMYKVKRLGDLYEGAFGGTVRADEDGTLVRMEGGKWRSAENAQVTDGHASTFLTHYFGNGNYFSIGDMFYGGHKNTPGPLYSTNPGLQRDYNNDLSFSVWNPAVANLFNMKNSVVWLCNNRFYKDKAGVEDSSHYINSIKYTGTTDFTSLAGGRLQQTAGISADYTNLNSTNDGHHNQFSGVFKETTKFAVGGGLSLSLPLAVKVCTNDDKVNAAFVPKFGAAFEREFWRISADVYRMVQFPNMDDLFWEGAGFHGNPDLKPETGWGGDVGLTVHNIKPGKGSVEFHGGVTVFTDYYEDKIQWGGGTTENLSSASYFGIDFNFGINCCDGLFTLDVNAEYLKTRLLDESNQYTYGKQIMWTPDFVCTAVFGLNLEPVKFVLSAAYTGKRYTSNMNLYYLKPYMLVDFAAEGAAIRGKFVPYLKLNNLLNWQYQSVERYTMPGISMTIGGRFTFF